MKLIVSNYPYNERNPNNSNFNHYKNSKGEKISQKVVDLLSKMLKHDQY